jgi:hypothetical protein
MPASPSRRCRDSLNHSSLAVTTTYLRRLEGQDKSREEVAEAIRVTPKT